MDDRYFHGIRTTAARALIKHAKDEVDWVGLHHLESAFQEMFCLPGSPMTRSNDFTERSAYILQKVIPEAISKVRDNSGKTPLMVKRFLFDKLKFNDNSNNLFSDNFYVASLMKSLCHAMLGRSESRTDEELDHFDMERVLETQAEEQLDKDAIAEFDRYRRMDEWSSSYQNVYSRAALHCQAQLMQAKILDMDLMRFLPYTRAGTYDLLRIQALQCLVDLDISQNPELLRWLMFTVSADSSAWVRHQALRLFGQTLAQIAFGRPQQQEASLNDGLIIEQESTTDIRREDIARRKTIPGAIEALKRELSGNTSFKEYMWAACNSPVMGLLELSELTDLCRILYDASTSKFVCIKLPRYWGVQNMGHGKLRFFRSTKSRMRPVTTKRKRDDHGTQNPSSTRITFKQSKTSSSATAATPLGKLQIPRISSATSSTSKTPATGTPKLKLKFGGRPT